MISDSAVDLMNSLMLDDDQNINVYLYKNQRNFQIRKYGYIAKFLDSSWYIGDNRGTKVLLTSPANPGNFHDYESVMGAVLHEVVHAYVSIINPDIALWLTEGMALYLSNGEPFTRDMLESWMVPSFDDTRSNNPIRLADNNGYTYAHTYIEYLDYTYSWDKVIDLVESEDYTEVLGKDMQGVYSDWINYLESH